MVSARKPSLRTRLQRAREGKGTPKGTETPVQSPKSPTPTTKPNDTVSNDTEVESVNKVQEVSKVTLPRKDEKKRSVRRSLASACWLIADTLLGTLHILRPFLSLALALLLIAYFIQYIASMLPPHFSTYLCPPFISRFLPFCDNSDIYIPDFSTLVNKQVDLYGSMNSQIHPDSISAVELKKVELATSDLRMMVKFSALGCAPLLDEQLGSYIVQSRELGRQVQILQARTKGTIDNLITYNTYMLRGLGEAQDRKSPSSLRGLRELYKTTMSYVEGDVRRLILAVQETLGGLDNLESTLGSIHEITAQELTLQRYEHNKLLSELWTIVGGNRLQRAEFKDNFCLLENFDHQRIDATQRLKILLHRLTAFQLDLEELRETLNRPIMEDAQSEVPIIMLPLEIQIENVAKGIERLRETKVLERKTIEA